MPAKRCNFYHVSCVCSVVSSQCNTSPSPTCTHSQAWTTLTCCFWHGVEAALFWASQKANFCSLINIVFFQYYPELVTTDEVGNIDHLVSCSGLSLPQEDSTHHYCHCTNLPVMLPLHSLLTHKQDPEMLKFLSPIWSGQQDDTSCTRSRYKILRPLKPSSPWLHLQILQIKIANRASDQGQPWLSQTPTKNESDLLPEMPGKFLQQLTGKGWPHQYASYPTLSEQPHRKQGCVLY